MPIALPKKGEKIEVVLSFDTALDMTEEEFDFYKQSYDKSLLKFKEGQQPTVFVLKKVLSYDQQVKVQGKQWRYEEGRPNFDISGVNEQVRQSLIGIENPPGVQPEDQITWKRDSDGATSKELMELLMAAGCVPELYNAILVSSKGHDEGLKKT